MAITSYDVPAALLKPRLVGEKFNQRLGKVVNMYACDVCGIAHTKIDLSVKDGKVVCFHCRRSLHRGGKHWLEQRQHAKHCVACTHPRVHPETYKDF